MVERCKSTSVAFSAGNRVACRNRPIRDVAGYRVRPDTDRV